MNVDHGAKLHDLPDEALVELLPIVKKIAIAVGADNYNVLQVRERGRFGRLGWGQVLIMTDSRVGAEQRSDRTPAGRRESKDGEAMLGNPLTPAPAPPSTSTSTVRPHSGSARPQLAFLTLPAARSDPQAVRLGGGGTRHRLANEAGGYGRAQGLRRGDQGCRVQALSRTCTSAKTIIKVYRRVVCYKVVSLSLLWTCSLSYIVLPGAVPRLRPAHRTVFLAPRRGALPVPD